MSPKKTYAKYAIVSLYCLVCSLCFLWKYGYPVASNLPLPSNTSEKACGITRNASKRLAQHTDETFNITIKELEYNDMRGELDRKLKSLYVQTISEVCTRYNLSTTVTKRHYLISPRNTSMYCWIRKIASTSFTKLYSELRNRRVSADYYKEIDVLSPTTIQELEGLISDKKVFKFLVVRHPFERIVSSYRNRIEDNTKYTAQAWIYAQRIFHLTRPYLFHTNATTGTSLSRIFKSNKQLKLVPTFKEFIMWLLQEPTKNDDMHWDSYYSHCSVCRINYDFIMKLEDYSFGEIDHIFLNMGLKRYEVYMPRLEESRGGSTDYRRTCNYFNTLTQDMIFKLYQRYKIDFEMFNYTYENYMECSTSNVS